SPSSCWSASVASAWNSRAFGCKRSSSPRRCWTRARLPRTIWQRFIEPAGMRTRPTQTAPQANVGSVLIPPPIISSAALLELAAWSPHPPPPTTGGPPCPSTPQPPPRLNPSALPVSPPPLWAHLSADRQQQLQQLLGQLLARLLEARRLTEDAHD